MKPQANPSTPLYDLLIECCRHEPGNAKLEEYAEKIIHWNAFLASAYAHGVYPLAARSLKTVSSVPEYIKTTLKITNLDIARRNMAMTSELLRIMKLLKGHGIKALAIKGPVLSQIIHGDIAIRQYADIDILIEQSDLWKAAQLLTKNGLIFEHDLKFLKNKTLLKIAKDITLSNEARNIHIELHWKLFDGKIFAKSNLKLFHESSTHCTINRISIDTLDHTVNLLFLLAHGSKHMWERMEWIVDIDRILRTHSDIDWDLMMNSAEAMGIKPMIDLGLLVVHKMFATVIPKECITTDVQLIDNAVETLLSNILGNKIILAEEEFLRDWRDIGLEEIRNKILYQKLRRFKLSTHEIYEMNLPTFLSPIYYLFLWKRLFLGKYFP